MAHLHLTVLLRLPCKFIHFIRFSLLLWLLDFMARELASHEDIKFFSSNTAHRHIRAREAQLWNRLSAIPLDYLPSIAAHSGPFLPRNPDASRSFIAQSEAQLSQILPIVLCPSSPGEPQEDFKDFKDLLRAGRQELSSCRNRSYTAWEEQVINSVPHSIEKKLVKMAVENNVYLAKLAEQAERYEGKITTSPWPIPTSANMLCNRNGGVHEERGICRPRTFGRRAQPPLCCL